jgi:hypothetical protein
MLRLIILSSSLLLIAPQDSAESIRGLIEKLGRDDIEVREGAAKELVRIGYSTLPALREAAGKSTGDTKRILDRIIGRVEANGAPIFVTIEAKDRPLREIVKELERQTLIPFRLIGAAADVKANVSAKETVVWKVVEDICRDRGDLMYRYDEDSVEIRSAKFRPLPCADHEGLRVFIDRFIWDRNQAPWGNGQFKMQGGVLTPAGAWVVWMQIMVEELRDDTGRDLTPFVEMSPMPDGDKYGLDSRRILFPQTYRPPQGPPALEATKFTRCRGKAIVWLAGGKRVLGRVKDPLASPSSPAPEGLPTFGVDRWVLRDGYLRFDFTAGWDVESVKSLDRKTEPLLVIHLKGGGWVTPGSGFLFHSGSEELKLHTGTVWAEIPEGAEIASFEVIVPDPILTVEIPFDFRDIPLR